VLIIRPKLAKLPANRSDEDIANHFAVHIGETEIPLECRSAQPPAANADLEPQPAERWLARAPDNFQAMVRRDRTKQPAYRGLLPHPSRSAPSAWASITMTGRAGAGSGPARIRTRLRRPAAAELFAPGGPSGCLPAGSVCGPSDRQHGPTILAVSMNCYGQFQEIAFALSMPPRRSSARTRRRCGNAGGDFLRRSSAAPLLQRCPRLSHSRGTISRKERTQTWERSSMK